MGEQIAGSKEKLALLRDMLTCGQNVYMWTYAEDGHLSQTNCPDLVLDTIFASTGCKGYMLEQGRENSAPMVLGAPLGLMWCAAFEPQGGSYLMHVIGPVFNTEVSLKGLNDALRDMDIPMDFKHRLPGLLRGLPIVPTPLFFQYGLMLHYCAKGEKLERSDIQYQERGASTQPSAPAQRDRHQTYAAEQALMWMVREGNLGYQSALDRAGGVSYGVQISGKPMEQAVISCAVFTSLCVRAAIQGGLSPETAYTLGDSYIQSMTQCKTVAELTTVNHEMYVDFVQRVHKHRANPARSKQIQLCCDYIDIHLEEPITLQQLAALVGYRDYYLSRKFKQEMGTNINDYIKFARVEKAKLLLAATNDPIRDIAKQLQFCSSSYFSQTFQQVTALTPNQWREHKGNPSALTEHPETCGLPST